MTSTQKLLEFPCDFPIKIICRNDTSVTANDIVEWIKPHWPACGIERVDARTSNQAHYISFTVHIVADNQQQIDAIYQTISAHPKIIMAL